MGMNPARLRETFAERSGERRTTASEEHGRDHEVQPVEAAGGEEVGHRDPTTFDEDLAHAPLAKGAEDVGRVEASVPQGQLDVVVAAGPGTQAPGGGPVLEHPEMLGGTALRIQDDANGVLPLAVTDRQLGVVVEQGLHPHHDGVDQGPQPMGVYEILVSADPLGLAGVHGHTPVQALGEMGDDQRLHLLDQRCVDLEQGFVVVTRLFCS